MVTPGDVALIVNQDAGKAPAKMKMISKLARQYKLKLKFCDGPDLDYSLRKALENKNLKRIIIGGGDGSISLAASLVRRINPKVKVAVLPVGTANYYAKSLGLSRSLTKAFAVSMGDSTEDRHLGQANKRDFLLGLNIGATSRMFAEVTDEDKKRFGKMAYARGIVRTLLRAEAPDVIIKANGKTYEYTSTELIVLNQHIQEPVKIMPDVKGSESYFEIITYGLGKTKWSPIFAIIIFAITFGHNQKYLKRIRATEAVIKTKNSQPVAIDGDSLGQTPVEVRMHKKPVTFICA